jgi:c-di-GMP-binding flagellar brake protein YcgR
VSPPGVPYKWPRRAHGRAPADWPCSIALGDADPTLGTTVNVAASGALLTVDDTPSLAGLAAGVSVRLVLSPPDRAPLECTARVVRTTPHTAAVGKMIVAVRFLDLPEAEEMKLHLLVLRATARRYLRCRVTVPCKLELASGMRVEGVSENLSGNGLLLIVPWPPPGLQQGLQGALGALAIRLGTSTVEVKLVEVIRIEERQDHSIAMALKYVEIDRDQRHAVVEYVFERVRDV